jgi:phage terminase small subunit
MLTPKKKAFVEYYKLDRNAANAARQAGYSNKYAAVMGHRLIHTDKDVLAIIQEWENTEKARIEHSIHALRPSKDKYIEMTFEKAKATDHAPTAAKYWELGGKAQGYLTEEQKQDQSLVNIICNELKISLSKEQTVNNTLQINEKCS